MDEEGQQKNDHHSMIVGLDPATVTGWCLPIPGGATLTGEWSGKLATAAPTLGREADPEGVRFLRIFEAFMGLIDEYPQIRGAVYEHTHSKSKRATEVLGGVVAIILTVCELRGLDYVPVPSPTLRAVARQSGIEKAWDDIAGRGTLKEGMRLAAVSHLGREVSNNESDAWWLTKWYEKNRADGEL